MIIALMVILGLCLGSFVNALVWRIWQQEKLVSKPHLNKADKTYLKELSIVNGRSMCPECKHELSPLDLIPVFSWLGLKGKCRYCHKPISWQYPLVEAATMALFIVSYLFWPVPIHGQQVAIFVLWLMILVGFMALIVYDLRWLLLPNRIIYPLTYIALAMAIINIFASPGHAKALLDEVLAVIIGGGIFYVLFQASDGRWIGGGDVRLGFLLGIVMATPGRSVLLIFLASLIGSLASLPLLLLNRLKRNSIIPFGPFLILSAIVVQLVGHFILSWYQNLFFPNGV